MLTAESATGSRVHEVIETERREDTDAIVMVKTRCGQEFYRGNTLAGMHMGPETLVNCSHCNKRRTKANA